LNRLAKLFEAISARDWNSAGAIARDVASAEERIGHYAAAQRLRGALSPNGRHPPADPGLASQETHEPRISFLSNALTPIASDRSFDEIRLKPGAKRALQEVTAEWAGRDKLRAHSLERRTKLLFHGPPGCGKSVTAGAIGRELGLPVYVVRFDAIVGAYLGQTALHLRQLFRFAETTPSVVLVDEVDALGKRRGSPLDVGELDRVVIALLQELEHSRPAGLLIATSNLARQLDDALWRRFDLVLEFPRPSAAELRSFATQRAGARRINLTRSVHAALASSKTYADVERCLVAEERRIVLEMK
jgi:SpoVK/Ycf46/Vps4 family AAA+-type ATPase